MGNDNDKNLLPNDGGMLQSIDALEAISRAEIDIQIATAKRFPRDVSKFRRDVMDYVKSSPKVAAGCFYTLSRREKDGGTKKIQGPSVRLAEICLSAWGNVRAGARPLAVLDDAVLSQAVFYDIEKNVAVTMEVRRSIRGSNGGRYSNDMINVTMQAASAIAFRNAVLKGIPAVFIKEAYDAALGVAAGSIKSIAESFARAIEDFKAVHVSREMILKRLGVMDEKQVTKDMLIELMGVLTAIDTGDSTIEEEFPAQAGKAEVSQPQATAAAKAGADPQTGEVKEQQPPAAAATAGSAGPVPAQGVPENPEAPINAAQVKAISDAAKRMKISPEQMFGIIKKYDAETLETLKRMDYNAVVEAMKNMAFGKK